MGLFGPSDQDLARLRSAVQSLGTTTVPGLSAALSWRERRTERALAAELERRESPVEYDAGRRLVRWARPLPIPPPAAEAPPSAPPVPAPVVADALPLRWRANRPSCPNCHVPLESTGSSNLAVCPKCGRLSTSRNSPPVDPAGSAGSQPPEPPSGPRGSTASGGDRRAQELFAAWLTEQPVPCPKCKTPLRHRGVAEYVCPACGQSVRFPNSAPSAPTPLPAR